MHEDAGTPSRVSLVSLQAAMTNKVKRETCTGRSSLPKSSVYGHLKTLILFSRIIEGNISPSRRSTSKLATSATVPVKHRSAICRCGSGTSFSLRLRQKGMEQNRQTDRQTADEKRKAQ